MYVLLLYTMLRFEQNLVQMQSIKKLEKKQDYFFYLATEQLTEFKTETFPKD